MPRLHAGQGVQSTQPAFPKRMDAHIKEWIDSRSAPRWTARWDHPLRGLGCGRRFLTQTQLPNRAGRTASLLLHRATAQGLGGSGGEGAVGGWQKRGGLKGSLSQIEGGRSRRRLSPGAGQGSHGGKVSRDPLASSADSGGGAPAAWCARALRAGVGWVWP